MKILLSILLFSFIFSGFQACKKKDQCDEAVRLDGGAVVAYFFSIPDNKYIYGANGFPSIYNKDSLEIKDQNGNLYSSNLGPTSDPRNSLVQISNVSWSSIMTQSEYNNSLMQEVSKNFYVRYSYNQYDTINFRFKCRKTECDSEFEYLRVYYKGSLVKEQVGDVYTIFTIKTP